MARKFRRWRWLIVGLLGPIVVALVSLLWIASSQIVAPGSLPLGTYQHDSLRELTASPAVALISGIGLEGNVPYLALSPVPQSRPTVRGAVLRDQVGQVVASVPVHGETVGALVLLHGRRGQKESLLRVAERFAAVGFHCVLPDLPAHGESPLRTVAYGARPFERTLARRLLEEVSEDRGWPENLPAGLWGMSMGGAFATAAAAESDRWKAAVITCSFDDLHGVIRGKLESLSVPMAAWMVDGVNQFTKSRAGLDIKTVRPVDWSAQVRLPILYAHGTEDALIPSARGRNLYDALASNDKEWLDVVGAGHDNVLITQQPVYAPMALWFLKHLTNSGERTVAKPNRR